MSEKKVEEEKVEHEFEKVVKKEIMEEMIKIFPGVSPDKLALISMGYDMGFNDAIKVANELIEEEE